MKYAIGFAAAVVLGAAFELGEALQNELIAGYLGSALVSAFCVLTFALGGLTAGRD